MSERESLWVINWERNREKETRERDKIEGGKH